MKGSLKVWIVILGMVVAGTGITHMTNSYVSHQIEKMAAAGTEKAEDEFPSAEIAAEEGAEENLTSGMERALTENPAEETGENMQSRRTAGDEEAADEAISADSEKDGTEALSQAEVLDEADAGQYQAERQKTGQAEVFAEDVPKQRESGEMVSGQGGTEPREQENVITEENDEADAGESGILATGKSAPVLEIVEYPTDLQEALDEYRERFPQIDQQIEQMRSSETENNVYSVKNTAQTEQRIWERELEKLYRLLCDRLDETSSQELQKEQQEWTQFRDDRAEEAAKKNSGGSLESVDYIASVAASNRERAYALLDKYQK